MVAAAALPVTALVAAAPAAAQSDQWPYREPVVKYAGDAKFKGDQATVKAVYRCYGGNQGTHVWVSLKQSKKIAEMPLSELMTAEGTSAIADAWYDTNGTDPQKVYVVCNGEWQKQTFLLTAAKGQLKKGKGVFLQFCLYDSTFKPEVDPNKGFTFDYSKVKVKEVGHLKS